MARNPYKLRTEPSMRDELNSLFDGGYPEISKKQIAVLRKMRRTGDPFIGSLTKCPCVDKVTGEPDLDTFCNICHGEGFLWDETFIDIYKLVLRSSVGQSTKEDLIMPGLVNIPLVTFFVKFNTQVTERDKIVELITDSEGNVIRPYRREKLYRIGTAIDYRADNGRIEYWKLDCYHEQRKFLNGLLINNG